MRSTISFFIDRQNEAKPKMPLQKEPLIASNRDIFPRKELNTVDKSGFDIKQQPKK